ncbi:MAG: oxidoreductase [Henriciella sp.]|uniref:NAD(P)-dependent oxidoreductase n=1 Tax=Henriciella sp. TaxID=1968823 RepID=UPI000C0F2888|nr:NAD(P)-dependent oxidoreductase [Henriciella sp.]MAN75565.1 oxidoreductase [Henriciella sp.]MBF34040.1 oxidoreductase [Hyphomonadaceae bacterium]MBK73894.1 oxidoreductase [Henriciella sp.]PHR81764.1 MAG: oxidoreductase [Henriciella sp.]|tara:strand:- start:29245 stop:30114 length:870 start_codon:yes stop_codon:yes gene_type:complete
MTNCAFLGLGVMGFPMAGHLAASGHDVTVWNRTGAKSADWESKHKGKAAESAADAVKDADFVCLCLGDDPDVEAVFDQIEDSLKAGCIVIDHTTASAQLARNLFERCNSRGAHFIDAPISGGQAGAEAGKLTIMCGGEDDAMEKARPVMEAYGARITHIGESGAGQLAKSVNQICIAGIVQGLSEGIHFAESNGLDVAKVMEAISGGAAQSWQMENRWKTMAAREFEHGFAVDWMRKDLRIALKAARDSGARLPVTALVDQFYADVQADGGNRWDTSSLVTRFGPPRKR